MGDELIPISDEQAKLLQEALKTLRSVGGYLREVLGTVPEDLVGLLGGDWLKVRRAENVVVLLQKYRERLEARGVKETQPANLTIALPLFQAAANESREQLQDMWARLLAAAVDPDRAGQVRLEYIELVKQMEPLDAAIFQQIGAATTFDPSAQECMASSLKVHPDEVEVSFANLHRLGLIGNDNSRVTNVHVTPKGKMLLRALSD